MANWSKRFMQLKKIKFKDFFNPKKWRSVVESKLVDKYAVYGQVHVIEQMMYRFLACSNCFRAGYCIGNKQCKGCGCDIPEKMLVLWEEDSCGNWGPVMSEEAWKQYKIDNQVTFILKEKHSNNNDKI